MGSRKSKKQTVGYKYYVGIHEIFCHGPIDQVTRIEVDDKEAFTGRHTGGPLSLNKPTLFGGEKREGGISGTMDWAFGGPTQTANAYLQSKLNRATLPAVSRISLGHLPRFLYGE